MFQFFMLSVSAEAVFSRKPMSISGMGAADQMRRRGAECGPSSMTVHRLPLERGKCVCFGRTIDRPASASFSEQVLWQRVDSLGNRDCGRRTVFTFHFRLAPGFRETFSTHIFLIRS